MMKKKIWELGMTVLLLTGVFWLARTGARLTGADAGAGNGVVLIDSGHGGSDPGKIGIHQEKEKDINLQIAKRLKKQLEKNGVKVYMTRENDVDLSEGDGGNRKVQDLKRRCEDSSEGKKLAEILQKHLVEVLDKENHRQAKGNRTYYMLKKTEATLVIVECGFLSNNQEALLLTDEKYQNKVAKAICSGTLEYLSSLAEKK